MGANLHRILVVDIEATCWETREEQGDRPNEVIEIGICALDMRTLQPSPADSYLIKPRFTEVSPFCTQLTGWTKEQIAEGGDPGDTLMAIADDYSIQRDDIWASYGEYDRIKLGAVGRASMTGLYGIPKDKNAFANLRTHLNVKTLFALKHRLKKEVGLDKAFNIAGLKMEGRHHNGADDAHNIARLLATLL